MSDHTTDEESPVPANGSKCGSILRRSPGDRINDMKAADQDAATAAPFMIAVPDHPTALEAVQQIAQRLGKETADRRWLVALVDRMFTAACETATAARHHCDTHEVDPALAEGAERVRDVLVNIMDDRSFTDV